MTGNEAPVTIEVEGRPEPIQAAKVAFGQHGSEILAHILTPDGRIATINNKNILVYWDNEPTEENLAHIDRMIREGNEMAKMKGTPHHGVEAQ